MAATGTPTPNLGLRIPIGTDPASVDDINYNSNLLDTKIGAVGNDSVQDQIDELNGKIGSPSSASDVNGNDAFSKIATLNNKVNYKITRYYNASLDSGGANICNAIVNYLEKNEFFLIVEEIGTNNYIFAHIHFVQGTLRAINVISSNVLTIGATNTSGTQVINGCSGSGASGTMRWVAW